MIHMDMIWKWLVKYLSRGLSWMSLSQGHNLKTSSCPAPWLFKGGKLAVCWFPNLGTSPWQGQPRKPTLLHRREGGEVYFENDVLTRIQFCSISIHLWTYNFKNLCSNTVVHESKDSFDHLSPATVLVWKSLWKQSQPMKRKSERRKIPNVYIASSNNSR